MVFASTKTPEQLAAEKKAKMVKLVTYCAKALLKVARMRICPEPIKKHLIEDVIPDLEQIAKAL